MEAEFVIDRGRWTQQQQQKTVRMRDLNDRLVADLIWYAPK